MVFVKQGPMKGHEGLPLIVVEAGVVGVVLLIVTLGCVDLYALVLHHDKASIDPFYLGDQLFLADRPGFGLLDEVGRVVVMLGGGTGSGTLGLGLGL